MFDLGASELLLIAIVAVVVIGPKDLPLAMRTAGRWVGKIRRVSSHFRSGIDAMIREAELEEMEKKWKSQNEAIMKEHPVDPAEMEPLASSSAEAVTAETSSKDTEASAAEDGPTGQAKDTKAAPQLPLPPP